MKLTSLSTLTVFLVACAAASFCDNTTTAAAPPHTPQEEGSAASGSSGDNDQDEDDQDDDDEDAKILLNEGRIRLTAPEGWERREPRTRIVEHEFAIPAEDSGDADGRVIVMGAGGSVEANVERWQDQFRSGRSNVREEEIAGQRVVIVDISGDYLDQPGGPFARGEVEILGAYRMLGAIIVTEESGKYFVKAYGPAALMEEQEEAFIEMLQSLELD